MNASAFGPFVREAYRAIRRILDSSGLFEGIALAGKRKNSPFDSLRFNRLTCYGSYEANLAPHPFILDEAFDAV
jgi:hypothetical protein